jgi:HSP20 family molecular chaperone IbpA
MGAVASDQSDHERVAQATQAAASSTPPLPIPVNAYLAPGAFVVVAPLPAVTPEDVTVLLRRGSLRITARLRSAGPRDYVLREWSYGGYERDVEVPEGFGGGVESSLTNGQLVVRVLRGPFVHDIAARPHPLTS